MSKPRTSLMRRIGVHVSGVVIAPENFRDDEEANPQRMALIQDVARASIGRSAGIKAYDLLISIDGKSMTDPLIICQYLKRAEKRVQESEPLCTILFTSVNCDFFSCESM